jgi:hypothetical protein
MMEKRELVPRTEVDALVVTQPIPGAAILVYGLPTTAPNPVVEQIHLKAMPVILMTEEECDFWMPAVEYRTTRSGIVARGQSAPRLGNQSQPVEPAPGKTISPCERLLTPQQGLIGSRQR